ncbi:MAG TPA: hypothetical protein VFZ25_17915 [Chloroflexota bacterium]|nr:hypothetical protein [Chloroflexota bacterium]
MPEQEAAEKHLQEAVLAVRAVERLKENLKKLQQDIQRVGDRGRRLKGEIETVAALRPVADDLPRRRAFHEELTKRLDSANRADGELQQLRQSIQRDQRRLAEGTSRVAEVDRRIAEADALPAPAEPVAVLETRLREITETRASARSQLVHARETRGQVAGGLCPFLHEECRNLRPGVDLASHFDAEIAHWKVEFERLERDYATADQATRRARQAEENRGKVAELNRQRGDLVAVVEEAGKHLAEAQERLREIATPASARTELERAARDAQAAWQAAEQAAREIERLPGLEREYQEARGEWLTVKAEQEADRAQLQTLANAEADVQAAHDALKALGGPRERAGHLRDEARALPKLREGRARKGDRVEALGTSLDALDGSLAGYAGLDEQLEANLRQRRARHADYLAYLKAADLAATLDDQTRLHSDAESAARVASTERAGAEAALAAAVRGYDKAEHDNQRQRRSDLDQTIARTRARIESAEGEDETLRARLAELARLAEEQAALAAHLDDIDEEKQLAGALRNAIRAAGPEITRQLLARISGSASRINAEVLNQAGIDVELTTDFEIVTRRQRDKRAFSQLSGGEQMAAALAVRLALLRELSGSHVAFLDEPTAHLDEERRSNLGDQVQRLKGFDQLIVISHDDTFDGLFGHVIRIEREDGKSQVARST